MNNEHVTVTQALKTFFERIDDRNEADDFIGWQAVAGDITQFFTSKDNRKIVLDALNTRIEATANVEPDTQALLQEAREALRPFASSASEWDGEPASLNVEFAAYDPPRMNPSALVAKFRNAAEVVTKLDATLGERP